MVVKEIKTACVMAVKSFIFQQKKYETHFFVKYYSIILHNWFRNTKWFSAS